MERPALKYLRDYFFIILGTAIAGFGIACFVTPAKIAPGGVNGIATIVYYLLGLDTGSYDARGVDSSLSYRNQDIRAIVWCQEFLWYVASFSFRDTIWATDRL
jgi:uncharacterized membrane-anchored protein YitT (DUF2179 family)